MFPLSTDALYTCSFAAFFVLITLCFLGVPQRRRLLWVPLDLFVTLTALLLPYGKVGYDALPTLFAIIVLAILRALLHDMEAPVPHRKDQSNT